MAKRKKAKRLAGFGLTKAEHQYRAVFHGKNARAAMTGVRKALAKGNCVVALSYLVDGAMWAGQMHSHGASRSARIKHRKANGRGSMGGTGLQALTGMKRRFAQVCMKDDPFGLR